MFGAQWNSVPMPCPQYDLTTLAPRACATLVTSSPMSRYRAPGLTCSMPFCRHLYAVISSFRLSASHRPTGTVSFKSPWNPLKYAVTSTLTTSPSRSARASGTPWQMTSFTDVQHDFGKL